MIKLNFAIEIISRIREVVDLNCTFIEESNPYLIFEEIVFSKSSRPLCYHFYTQQDQIIKGMDKFDTDFNQLPTFLLIKHFGGVITPMLAHTEDIYGDIDLDIVDNYANYIIDDISKHYHEHLIEKKRGY